MVKKKRTRVALSCFLSPKLSVYFRPLFTGTSVSPFSFLRSLRPLRFNLFIFAQALCGADFEL